jgi:hypothetical protein
LQDASRAGDRPDQALLFTAVTDRLAHGVDVAGQGRFGDDAPAPDHSQQVVLADDVLAILHEVEQQVEDLRPNRDGLGMPGQLPPIGVERVLSEQILHFRAPSPRSMNLSVRPRSH